MQDFTKITNQDLQATPVVTTVTNAFGGIYDKKLPKKGFIEARKNKDNFWNLMFAVGMTVGMSLVFIIALPAPKPFPYSASIAFWVTLIAVPLFIKHFSKITFTEGKFLNGEGREIDIPKQLPNMVLVIATTIGATILNGVIFDTYFKNANLVGAIIFLIIIFFIPALFFIAKNCPISILFSRALWKFQRYDNECHSHNKASPFTSLYDDLYSPSRSYLSYNSHHRSR